eukprot:scaffold19957_cov118-Isochrysis_galbana.AAC.2
MGVHAAAAARGAMPSAWAATGIAAACTCSAAASTSCAWSGVPPGLREQVVTNYPRTHKHPTQYAAGGPGDRPPARRRLVPAAACSVRVAAPQLPPRDPIERSATISTKDAHRHAHAPEPSSRTTWRPLNCRAETSRADKPWVGSGSASSECVEPQLPEQPASHPAAQAPAPEPAQSAGPLAGSDSPSSPPAWAPHGCAGGRRGCAGGRRGCAGGSRGWTAPRANETTVPVRPANRSNRSSAGDAAAPSAETAKKEPLTPAGPPPAAYAAGERADSRLTIPCSSTASSASTAAASAARDATPEAPHA